MHKHPAVQPHLGTARYCAVTLRGEDPDGWLNTGHTLTGRDPQVWISFHGAREVAKAIGWASPQAMNAAEETINRLNDALDHAAQEISDLRKWKEGVTGLADDGYELVRKGGQPSVRTRPENIKAELKEKAEAKEQTRA